MASLLTKMACVVLACMVVFAPHAEAALNCGTVVSKLIPCLPYLRNGGKPTPGCCAGVTSLNQAASSTADKKTACGCLKNASTQYKVGGSYSSSLPSVCGVKIPYKISPSTDCSKIK